VIASDVLVMQRVATKMDDGRAVVVSDGRRCITTDSNSKTNGKSASKRPNVVVGDFARDDSRMGGTARRFVL
jgi:hypothetical protein